MHWWIDLVACLLDFAGAQFGGKYFCHDIRVIRLPRHGERVRGCVCGREIERVGDCLCVVIVLLRVYERVDGG